VIGLVLYALPFAVVSGWSGRVWTLGLPLRVWGGLAVLQAWGIIAVYSGSPVVALIAISTLFAFGGLGVNARPRTSRI
jgi:hypothetical protein